MAVAVGQRCVVRIQITDVEPRKARDIKATIVSPQGEEKCQNVSFDEVSGVVYASVDVNSVGSWSMWLGVCFDKELFYTPAFVFAEVEGDAKPCDAPYIVDVEVAGESVSVTPPKVDVDAVTREEFYALSKEVSSKVDKVDGKGLSANDFTDEYKKKVDEFTIDTGLSPTSNNAIANSAVVQGLAGLAEGVSEAIGNVAKNVEQNTADIKTKQDTLTLTTKPNGNIVIGNLAGQSKEFMPATPSGDALHNWFSSIGGIYNPDTNLWSLLGVENMTSADMLEVAQLGTNRIYPMADLIEYSSLARVVVGKKNGLLNTSSKAIKMANFLANNPQVEVVQFSTYDIYSNYNYPIYTTSMGYAFYACAKLRIVRNKIDVSGVPSFTSSFAQCSALEILQLQGLKADISFAQSPLLSKESLLYMIENCASNVNFTITLHPDVYAKCTRVDEGEGAYEGEWWTDIDDALGTAEETKNTTITLASA